MGVGIEADFSFEEKKQANEKLEYIVIRQDWLESERGWGVESDGYSLHLTLADLEQFIDEYWVGMPREVPEIYSRPCGEPYKSKVDEETYKKVKESKNGIRLL